MTDRALTTGSHEVRLAAHLDGELTHGHFSVVRTGVSDGEVVVRNEYLHLAAAFQDLMRADCDLPMPPYEIGGRVGGGAVGTVLSSQSPDLSEGDLVMSFTGWGEHAAGPASAFHRIDRGAFPDPSYYLSQGPTAYHGMVDVAGVGPGDVVFVSGAAGGVGSLAGQIARCRGAEKVIGSAGSQEKVDHLVKELGFDAAFNYRDGHLAEQLGELAPSGISVFFDNVGGRQFEAAMQVAARGARFALCGSLASQNGAPEGMPRLDVLTAITRGVQLRPFACYHLPEQIAAWYGAFGGWLGEGRFTFPHQVIDGDLADVPGALIGLLRGDHTGNVTVRIA